MWPATPWQSGYNMIYIGVGNNFRVRTNWFYRINSHVAKMKIYVSSYLPSAKTPAPLSAIE